MIHYPQDLRSVMTNQSHYRHSARDAVEPFRALAARAVSALALAVQPSDDSDELRDFGSEGIEAKNCVDRYERALSGNLDSGLLARHKKVKLAIFIYCVI